MTRSQVLKQVEQRRPCANDMLRGWHDAERGVEFSPNETDDWQLGWRLWNHEHGGRRSSHSWH
jgi:hypothetical protein